MRRTVHAALLVMALAGYASPTAGVTSQPNESMATTSPLILLSTASATAPPAAADGSDIGACYDGTCEISVSGPVRIPLDGRSGFDEVAVEAVEPNMVHFRVDYPNGFSSGAASPGGTVTFTNGTGGTRITVVAIDRGAAVLRMSPL